MLLTFNPTYMSYYVDGPVLLKKLVKSEIEHNSSDNYVCVCVSVAGNIKFLEREELNSA